MVPWSAIAVSGAILLSQGSPLSQAQSALKLSTWAECCKRCRRRLYLLGANNEWQTGFSVFPVFQQWKLRAVPSEKCFCCLAVPQGCRSTQQGAEGVFWPLGCGQKCAPAVYAVEKVPILCSLHLDFEEVPVLSSGSMGFCGRSLEWHPNKVKSSFYSASLDKVGFLTWDTEVGPSMWNTWGALNYQAVKQALCWAPHLCFAFFCAVNY